MASPAASPGPRDCSAPNVSGRPVADGTRTLGGGDAREPGGSSPAALVPCLDGSPQRPRRAPANLPGVPDAGQTGPGPEVLVTSDTRQTGSAASSPSVSSSVMSVSRPSTQPV